MVAKLVRTCGITKVGTLRDAENEFSLQRYLTRCGLLKRLLDTGADEPRDDHESKRHESSADTVPMANSGVKRSNLEAIRRADAEAEKALKRAKLQEDRRAAK